MTEISNSRITSISLVIGQVLATHRKRKGLDQGTFAKKMQVTQSTWSKVERGESSISLDQLFLAANVLSLSPTQLVKETENSIAQAEQQGVNVEAKGRISDDEQNGLGWVGAAAIAGLVALALNR